MFLIKFILARSYAFSDREKKSFWMIVSIKFEVVTKDWNPILFINWNLTKIID